MKFQVEFTINRLPLRLQHRAVELAVQHKLKEVLFPTESNVPTSGPQLSLRSVLHELRKTTCLYLVCDHALGINSHSNHSMQTFGATCNTY